MTLTGSDEAMQADVFLFALGETPSLTFSWLILGLGLSQSQCLYLPLHTLSLQEGRACNYVYIGQSGCSWGSCAYLSVHSSIRCCGVSFDLIHSLLQQHSFGWILDLDTTLRPFHTHTENTHTHRLPCSLCL